MKYRNDAIISANVPPKVRPQIFVSCGLIIFQSSLLPMKLDTVTKDAIYKLTDKTVNMTVAINEGRPVILLNADMSNAFVGETDVFVVLILNSRLIILCWLMIYLKRCGRLVREM